MDIFNLKYNSNICISGLTASGKTTHAHLLAGEFGLTYVSGSQIQLNFLGVSPIQTKDFWITAGAKSLWNPDQFRKIDSELMRIELAMQGCIFDTSTMPWRHRAPAFCIWLESDLESRVKKSIISHRGNSQFAAAEYPEKIAEKDRATIDLYKSLYGIKIGTNLSVFDMIIDISKLMSEPTLTNSLESIRVAHIFVRAASAYHLTSDGRFMEELLQAKADYPDVLKHYVSPK